MRFHEEPITSAAVVRLLDTLEVRLHGCTLCIVPSGTQVTLDAGNTLTIYYVLSGQGVIQTGEARRDVSENCVMITPARLQQTWGAVTDDKRADFQALPVGQPLFAPFDDQWWKTLGDIPDRPLLILKNEITITNAGVPGLFEYLRVPISSDIANDSVEQRLWKFLILELERPEIGSATMIEGLLKALLILVLRRQLRESEFVDAFAMMSDARLARAMILILQKPADAHTVDTLAAAAGMSRTAFLERFRKAFAQSPIEFLQGFRLKFAAHLLQTTRLPIKSVAVAVGYTSRSYFSRLFSVSYGSDPSTYRIAHQAREPRLVKPGTPSEKPH